MSGSLRTHLTSYAETLRRLASGAEAMAIAKDTPEVLSADLSLLSARLHDIAGDLAAEARALPQEQPSPPATGFGESS